jgi:uncharacterized protein
MIVYLDSSVLLRYLLNQPPLLESFGKWEVAYTSELAGVEARRTFDRLRLTGQVSDGDLADLHDDLGGLEKALGIVSLTSVILEHASRAMPTAVKTLDAIHLATAMQLRESQEKNLVFATHDLQQSTAARALGFTVI